jgi:exopolyphosphatase / guanosine-5'-triphosphate,3'-diphosphate pyrophosphatase
MNSSPATPTAPPAAGPTVAIVDIGSNSIKVLVVSRAVDGQLVPVSMHTLDARISAGISRAAPRLSEAAIGRGIEAVTTLLAHAAPFQPARTVLVATSAVRDAQNGDEFRARVRAATGHEIRLLSGEEEANLIGRGLTCDPALTDLRDFYVFDLGGGSLECLAFRDRRIQQAVSLQLGCVRLTEKFVADPTQPLSADTRAQIAAYVRELIARGGFTFSLPAGAVAVGTGGTLNTLRTMLAARTGRNYEDIDSLLPATSLAEMLDWLNTLAWPERQRIPGLPPARADVFPTALATLLAVADLGGLAAFRNSLYNLRFGLAADELAQLG